MTEASGDRAQLEGRALPDEKRFEETLRPRTLGEMDASTILPYMFFFPHASYFCNTFFSGSARRMNGSSNFSSNFLWLDSVSLLIPITTAFFFILV